MDTELNRLIAFMEQLAACGMGHKAILARGYDFALLLCRRYAEKETRSNGEISLLEQSYVMDHTADLLKSAVERGIEKQATSATIECEHLGKRYKGIVYETKEERDNIQPDWRTHTL